MTAPRLVVNMLICGSCGWGVYSRARHDFRTCPCGAVHVDGGFDYFKCGYNPQKVTVRFAPYTLLVKKRETLYADWNMRRDKYGLVSPEKVPLTPGS
jgi:hypothetical protein